MTKLRIMPNQNRSDAPAAPLPDLHADRNAASGNTVTPHGEPMDWLVPGAHWSKTTRDGTALTVRVASPADEAVMRKFCDTLHADVLYKRFNQAGVSSAILRQILANPRGVTLMAMRDDKPVALSEYYDSTPRGSTIRTCEVAVLVHQDHQRHGIGSTLSSEVMRIAKAKGFQRIEWIMLKSNKPMIHMNKKMGLSLQSYKDDPSFFWAEKPVWFSGLRRSVNEKILSYLPAAERGNLIEADPMIARLPQEPTAMQTPQAVAMPDEESRSRR